MPLLRLPVAQQALGRAGWTVAQIERFEINEAFPAIVLAVLRELDLSEDMVMAPIGAITMSAPQPHSPTTGLVLLRHTGLLLLRR
ncbi:hypothetical protein [Hoeflea alexandrii]|uniref:hypothetical protein n=1 Tax=Hoeflea alexandrii TaxID=288436 RepID=UPI003D2F888E